MTLVLLLSIANISMFSAARIAAFDGQNFAGGNVLQSYGKYFEPANFLTFFIVCFSLLDFAASSRGRACSEKRVQSYKECLELPNPF